MPHSNEDGHDPEGVSVNRVLLVEDSAFSAVLVKSVFAESREEAVRAEVVHFETLAEGIAFLAAPDHPQIDVVLLDLTLPDSSGLDTLRRFRAAAPDLAVVVLTATDDEATGRQALSLGAQDFLIKDEAYPRLLLRQTLYAALRKREQLALKHAKEEAEAAALLREKFVSLVAHDLRGPLGGMVGIAELLLDEIGAQRDIGEQRDLAARIVDVGHSLLGVVESLLDISRLQTGRVTPLARFIDAHHLVESVFVRVADLAHAKEIELVNQVEVGSRLFADASLLGQVVQNLLTNAIKFSHRGGKVRVYTPPTLPGSLAVQDRGVGLSADDVKRIFDLGERISTLGTAGEKGNGFGLPYSHGIVAAHGGELGVESQPGKGSTFTIRLPRKRPRVLVVDDQQLMRVTVAQFLKHLDVEVVEAESGSEALAMLRRGQRVDLMILDVVMEGMGGLELLEQLAANPATEKLPVIIVTGDTKLETRERAFYLGAADFTVKPLVAHEFVPRVRRVVG